MTQPRTSITWFILAIVPFTALAFRSAPIDRHAVVTRHNVTLNQFDVNNPLSIGNGGFAFTVDATGLQTFAAAFDSTTPLGTLSDWGWHTFPNPDAWSIDKFHFTEYPDLNGRMIPYADVPHDSVTPEIRWLRENPHRLDLGQIGFVIKHRDGSLARADELTEIKQVLDLWNGSISSHFWFDGESVDVETVCSPELNAIAVHVVSTLLAQRRLGIRIRFPYGTPESITADWTKPDAHTTTLHQPQSDEAEFARTLDQDSYTVVSQWSTGATLTTGAKHEYVILPVKAVDSLDVVCGFSRGNLRAHDLPAFVRAKAASREYWHAFWKSGGAIDLSASKDPRWFELERRIVLSQYLTAIQDAGEYPPQETGLTYNSWNGKFHLEMHWWHEAHFALWNRVQLLEKSLGWYQTILPRAEATARKQGYDGARWPKMTDPSGNESPSSIGPFLIWQEPHPIFYAELCHRAHPGLATLEKFKNIVFQTAQFMASFATWDARTERYVLGPVLQCAQEIFPKNKTLNPTFELAYWRWGLETAQLWRERLGLKREVKWDSVLTHLAQPAVGEDKYFFTETMPDSYTNPKWVHDHPSVIGALSFLPGPGIERETMRRTLDWVWNNWNWTSTWGWDYPMIAVCAARLGEPARAVDALLLDTPKNHFGPNGHVYQRPGLTVYLPANGGLLYAVAMMAAGWDGAPHRNAPGFPDDGNWNVQWEKLERAL